MYQFLEKLLSKWIKKIDQEVWNKLLNYKEVK